MLFILLFTLAQGHGLLSYPRQRGALNLPNHPIPILDTTAPTDYEAHYPAGSKSAIPGSGTASLKRAAGGVWTPYNPYDINFQWRAGVCGDDITASQDHLLGGRYYHHGAPVATWQQGDLVFFETEIITHHNGFFEFHICNLDTCRHDISTTCFIERHCQPLLRVACDTRQRNCSPVDRTNPWRWYLPCRQTEQDTPEFMGGPSGTMAYALPQDLTCEKCVLQWYWTSANSCNPPGVVEYFTGPDRPQWGDCPGQGGAIGGWARDKPTCGGDLFPEEYFQCADVRILPNPSPRPSHPPNPPTSPTAPVPPTGVGPPPPTSPPPTPQAPQHVAAEDGEDMKVSVTSSETSEEVSGTETFQVVQAVGSEEDRTSPRQDTETVVTEDENSGDGSEISNVEEEEDTGSSFARPDVTGALGIHHSQF